MTVRPEHVKHIKRLQSFCMRCLRIILGISVREKQRNTDVRAKASIETVETMIRQAKVARPCSQDGTSSYSKATAGLQV